MAITSEMVKELRQVTGAGVLDCKRALQESNGDFDKAVEHLRKKGLAAAAKRAMRVAEDGVIGVYVHHGNRVASMVELNCETDFVARTPQFQTLAHDLAMQVAATQPQYLSRDDVPPEVIETEKEDYRTQMAAQNKPDHILERIVEGKLEKFFREVCILEQAFIKDEDLTVDELIKNAIAQTGENIVLRRFVRYEIGK